MKKGPIPNGFALPAVIFALIVLGVLSTGGFYLARQESRIGMASERAKEAFYFAERGANQVMSQWDMGTYGALEQWGYTTISGAAEGGSWSVRVTRMSPNTYFLLSTGLGTDGSGLLGNANRMLGVVARHNRLEIDPPAAFTARDQVTFVGKAAVKGVDVHPPDWGVDECYEMATDKPGMLTNDSSKLTYQPQNLELTGDPPLMEDAAMVDEAFKVFGNMTWEELTAMATLTLAPRTFNSIEPSLDLSGNCNVMDPQNWGDPENAGAPCFNHFPMIHIKGPGSSFINGGGIGQGLLLVDGNLTANGDFVFYGLIIVKGRFETGGAGNRVYGAVMAGNAQLEDQALGGGSLVQYSNCALTRAVDNNPLLNWVRPLDRRSWVDLSSVVSG